MHFQRRSRNIVRDIDAFVRDGGPLRSYLYVSDSKLDSLIGQFYRERKETQQVKATIKVLEMAQQTERGDLTREMKVRIVESYLRENDSVKQPFEGDRWIAGELPMHWGRLSDTSGHMAAVALHLDEQRMLLLGGSTRHLLSEAASAEVSAISMTDPGEVFDLLASILRLLDSSAEVPADHIDGGLQVRTLGSLLGYPGYNKGALSLPVLNLAFLARVYQTLPQSAAWLPSVIQLGSPLYVSLD